MLKRVLAASAIALAAASAQADVLLSEGFDDVTTLSSSGWTLLNKSTPVGSIGSTGFFQGDQSIFSSQKGAAESYIASNYNATTPGGTVDSWLISPSFSTASAGTVVVYAKAASDSSLTTDTFAFGLAFSSGSSFRAERSTVMIDAIDTASFTSMVEVDPAPGEWTKYTLHFSAHGVGSTAQFAINYFGPEATANYIGFDSFSVNVGAVPEPATWMAMAAGLAVLGVALRRRA